MRINGNLELVGGKLVNAVLETLAIAPATDATAAGRLFMLATGPQVVGVSGDAVALASGADVAAANQAAANAAQAAVDAAAASLSLASGGTVVGAVTFEGGVSLTGTSKATQAAVPSAANDLVNKSYVDGLLVTGVNGWEDPIIGFVESLPGSPTTGDRVILNAALADIREYDGADWTTTTVDAGTGVFVDSTDAGYWFNGTAWVRFTGSGSARAGAGLVQDGAILNLNPGNGVEIVADAVLVKAKAAGGVIVDADGVSLDFTALSAAYLDLTAGGTVTGELSVAVPTAAAHAATKKYVDDAVAAVPAATTGVYDYSGASSTSHNVNHGLGTKYVGVTVIGADDKVLQPESITFVDADNLTIVLSTAEAIRAVVVGTVA